MKIFADYHHEDLYHSLYLLFEKRLGWELYRPIGLEWHTEKYWCINDCENIVNQFLSIEPTNCDKPYPDWWLNRNNVKKEDGIYNIYNELYDCTYRGITLDRFKQEKFDIVLSSLPVHFNRYEELRKKYQPQAKHIFQMGNHWTIPHEVKNLLNSTTVEVANGINYVRYHQEFDLNVFNYIPCLNSKIITNLMHFLSVDSSFYTFEKEMPNFKYVAHGNGNRDGIIYNIDKVFKNSGWIWHVKFGGDGYGYNVHQAMACGRPLITNIGDYVGKLGELLMTDKETCLNIGDKSFEESVLLIKQYSQPEIHIKMCENAYARFNSIVNFDAEFESVKLFLERLV